MNRIFTEQLPNNLGRGLSKLYCLVGLDPLLLSESQDLINQKAFTQGFDEKIEFTIEQSTDWNLIFEQLQSMGLFFNRQVITLNLPENLTALMQNQLHQLLSLLHEDVLLILLLPKLTKPMEKQSWFTLANSSQFHATLINCQTPNIEQLPHWINQRGKAMDLQIEPDAVQLLCYSYENNLLALKQCLQLLALLYPDHRLTFSRVKDVVEQSSIFTPFQWIDALLEGKAKRARRILAGLRVEEVQPVILLRTLQRELVTILHLTQPQQPITTIDEPLFTGQLREQFDRLKVWQNRRAIFSQAIQRLTYRKLYLMIQELADLERLAKQEFSEEIWVKLENLQLQ